MSDNTPHRHSLRLKAFDYASAGAYFVTLCAYQRECVFGRIQAGVMRLSVAGEIVRSIWEAIPAQYQHVEIAEFVVMPNHIHGIIVINDPAVGARFITPEAIATQATVGAQFIAPKNLGEIVRAYKARCTHAIKQSRPVWQRNYYEHIIRNEQELAAIREYITNNPLQWDLDEKNPNRNTVGA